MADVSGFVIRAFAGGELSPALALRADIAKYTTGLRTCRNFIVQRTGGAANRPGTRFVAACKTNAANVKLLRYRSDVEGQSVLIEAGEGYLRFFENGAPVIVDIGDVDDWSSATDYVIGDLVKSGGVIYYCRVDNTNQDPASTPDDWAALAGGLLEIPTPFGGPGIFNASQSGQTITLTARDTAPHELIFLAITRWVFREVDLTPQVGAPQNPILTLGAAGALKVGYVVTAAHPVTYEESEASAQVVSIAAAAPTDAAPNVVSWDAQITDGTASPEYYVYKDPYGNGTYGFIGTATGTTSFNDPGITPDFTQTPPTARPALFSSDGDFPAVSATFQQRRFFASTANLPDAVWGSRVGFPSSFSISSPLQDDDAIDFKIAGNDHHPVRQMAALKAGLVLLTDGGEWTLNGPQGSALTPSAIALEQETYVGAAPNLRPAVVGNGVVYVQGRGSVVRELKFDVQVEGLGGRDLTVFAAHLFDGFTLRAMDFQVAPNQIVWCVRSDGTLLGLTYVPEQDVWGWHRHDTASGIFWDVCVLPEEGEDVVYVIAARDFGGGTQMWIERLASRVILDFDADSFFVDAGLSYSGAPVSAVSGLDHLEGQLVKVLADGLPLAGPFTVAGGAVALTVPASNVHVGLPIVADLETMDLDVAGASVRDKRKRVASLTAVLQGSGRTFFAGPTKDKLVQFRAAVYDSAAKAFDGDIELAIAANFNEKGRVFLRQVDPLPITVLGLVPSVEIGG